MINRDFIGYTFPPRELDVEKGRLRFFAKAIGQTDPIYGDEEAAKAAGHRSLPVPPTFLWCLRQEKPDPYDYLEFLNIDLAEVLHGGQKFKYHNLCYAGDRLTLVEKIANIYDKKDGQLEFLEEELTVTNQDGLLIAELLTTIVVQHREKPNG
jgi:hypothetical protein